MDILVLIALIGVIALLFIWPGKSPSLKRAGARPWPPAAVRGKAGLKPRPTSL